MHCSCRGYIGNLGLSPNQLLHIPGAGDFQIDRIEGAPEPLPVVGAASHSQRGAGDGMLEMPQLLAPADTAARESLQRENDVDTLAGEQTWPTDQARALYHIPSNLYHVPTSVNPVGVASRFGNTCETVGWDSSQNTRKTMHAALETPYVREKQYSNRAPSPCHALSYQWTPY